MDTYSKFEPLYFTISREHGYLKDSPSPPAVPPPPDPGVAIAAQARALPSVYSPGGSSIYSGDPNVTGSFARTDTLSPAQAQQFQYKNEIAKGLLERVGHQLSPGYGISPDPYKFDAGPAFRGAEDPTTNRTFMAQKALLDPVFAKDEERLTQRLANQGLPTGSGAYDEEFRQFRQSKDSAYEQAAANAVSQGFAQDQATRQQGFQQDIGQRQQQFNEIAAALGGSQLTPIGQGGNPIDTTSALAAQEAGRNRQYQGQMAGYNADVASNNATTGAIGSLAGAAAMAFF